MINKSFKNEYLLHKEYPESFNKRSFWLGMIVLKQQIQQLFLTPAESIRKKKLKCIATNENQRGE